MNADPWLSLSELRDQPWCARELDTLRRHIKAGILPAQQDPVSKRWRVRESVARGVYGARAVPNAKAAARAVHAKAKSAS